MNNLSRTAFDWSAWDDAYGFIEDRNQDFIETNLVSTTFNQTGLRLNGMIFCRKNGEVVFSKGYDFHQDKDMPLPKGLTGHLTSQGLLRHETEESAVKGLITLPQGVLMVVSRPILTSKQTGPARGALVMARYFDPRELERIAEKIHLSLVIHPLQRPVPEDVRVILRTLSNAHPIEVQPQGEDRIGGYILLSDLYGQPACVVKLNLSREIYAQGKRVVSHLIWFVVIGGGLFGALILVFLEKTILARVAELSREVQEIEGRADLAKRLPVNGADELAELGEDINRMLGELAQTEQELIRLERVRALGEMAAGINHNLNNILVGVVISADLLKEETKDPGVLKRVEMIQASADQAQELVARLQMAVRSDEEETEGVQVNQVIQEAVTAGRLKWKDEAEARGIGIRVSLSFGESVPPVKGTVTGLYNIILNLLFNAVDALPEGGDITISTGQTNDRVLVSVRDNGIGMDELVKKRIFEPFFTTKLEIGTGLGLSTVYNTLIRWGGKIEVNSAPGTGSEFALWLPAEFGVDAEEEGRLEVPDVRAGRILVVDDQEAVGIMVEDILRSVHEVTRVMGGKEALECFAEAAFDVALLDLGMPGIPGDQVAQELRRLDPNIVTILMTGWHLEPNDPRLALFDFHLRKPLKDLDEVRYIVAQAILRRDEGVLNP